MSSERTLRLSVKQWITSYEHLPGIGIATSSAKAVTFISFEF